MNIEPTPVAAVVPALVAAPARRTRAPKRKTRITIYLDDEVLDEFRSLSERCGTGYQTLINAALRKRLGTPFPETGVV
ncbi:BrnA antitoxin family protein [Massilia sp. YIM B02443]|uniref:BrnA antitoxin family protein n=1 Tax=Massilia sp. YIM B02443 TaxID=3050127 RepID=UPI0025B67E24|nr:BrnA antitoxin family protein [Massilia sp. YIM B02443]MDN4037100.1 BrnA antitoxin family protein [Massilia sp. YIM B02443]